MARSTQTHLAILAALSIEPMTGYGLRAAIRTHLSMFWSESFGQIYPALARLRLEGLVEVNPGGRVDSSVHSLTANGRARLVELLQEPPIASPPRNGLLLRLFFGDVLGAEACVALIAGARAAAMAQLDTLAVARAEAESEPPEISQRLYWLITISAGERSAAATVAWADDALEALKATGNGRTSQDIDGPHSEKQPEA